MKAGDLKVTVFPGCGRPGQGSGRHGFGETCQGQTVEKKVYIPFQLVTPANMSNFEKKN